MIDIHDLWKAFEGNEVLKGLTLTVKKGETLVILGRSGVGKSVLLKHIIGISHADKGYIEVDGVRVSDLRGEKRYKASLKMGMLFQGNQQFFLDILPWQRDLYVFIHFLKCFLLFVLNQFYQ